MLGQASHLRLAKRISLVDYSTVTDLAKFRG